MIDLFISDLHLDQSRPECVECLVSFLRDQAAYADRLFVLGDLFEVWIGDDVVTELTVQVAEAFSRCAAAGTEISFIAGNRDFLIGQQYARSAGMTILGEPSQISHSTLEMTLLHGDILCTDDIEYQSFRRQVRNQQWQAEFLSLPVSQRYAYANQARQASSLHTHSATLEIMDVNQDAVVNFMNEQQSDFIIHGHTHRPAIHEFDLNQGSATRIVLGDWYEQGSVLIIEEGIVDLQSITF